MSIVDLVTGAISLVLGAAYLGLGVLAAAEVAVERRVLGVSRFGLGFAAMAATCGPHHLLHGLAALGGRTSATPELALAALVGTPAGLVFVLLRFEALTGGRGDRTIRGTPNWLVALPTLFATAAGALVTSAVLRSGSNQVPVGDAGHAGHTMAATGSGGLDLVSLTLWTNVLVAVAYSLVGWPLLRTQVRRHHADDGWSVSGLSLAAIFPTCALMHVVHGVTAASTAGHAHPWPTAMRVIDVVGVPASLVFLWVVRALYRDAIVDWNRRPAAGAARRAPRPSPWTASPRT